MHNPMHKEIQVVIISPIIMRGVDKALYADGCFKGACCKCGIIGHKAADRQSSRNKSAMKQSLKATPCPDNDAPSTSSPKPADGSGVSNHPQFQGTCIYCKWTGHREAQCFNKLRDQLDNFGFTVMMNVQFWLLYQVKMPSIRIYGCRYRCIMSSWCHMT
jgi:hypothetical protein